MELRFCKTCVMDGSAREIELFGSICNFCLSAQAALGAVEKDKDNLRKYLEQIKKDGRSNKYDVLIGLSGGVDSSYALYKLVKLGLRPLCYTIDNGYNDPKADENILNLVESLKVPFYRYVIDLPKFKDLQSAFIKVGLKNIEIPTDHILMASSLELAAKYGIKWIISGGNVATESIMPASWGHNARDLTHIKDVYKKDLTGLPTCSIWKWNWYKWVKGIKTFYLLDYLNYDRKLAERWLITYYSFQSTGEKHEESFFTRWFQSFYLFQKFSIDKRKAHYSSLIISGQMTREEAITLLGERPVYPEFGIEQKVLNYPKHRHEEFKMDKWYGRISKFIKYVSFK